MSSSDKQKDEIVEISSDSDQEEILEISSTSDDDESGSNYENHRALRNLMVLKPRPMRKAAQQANKRFKTHPPTTVSPVWTKASSKCTSTSETTELKSDEYVSDSEEEAPAPCQNEAEFSIKREDFSPHVNMGHNDKMRQIEHNEFGVASDEKEISQAKGNREGNKVDDAGRLHTKEEYGSTSKSLSDCEVAIVDLEERFYFMYLLWSGREVAFSGDKLSITLRDQDMQLRNAMKARSPANGIAHIFNGAIFKDQPQDVKEEMKKRLKDCVRSHLVGYNMRAIEDVEKAVDAIPFHT